MTSYMSQVIQIHIISYQEYHNSSSLSSSIISAILGSLHGVRSGMDQFRLPDTLSLEGNLAENWRRWKQQFDIYLVASGKNDKSDEVKAATFLHLAGPEALELFNTFAFESPGDEKKLDKLEEKFEAYCIPRKNVTWERHVFNTRNQQPGETVDQYVTILRKKVKTCEFGTLTESLIKDRLVCGVISDKTRSRLLKQADLTLSKAMDICRAAEINGN